MSEVPLYVCSFEECDGEAGVRLPERDAHVAIKAT